MHTYVCTYTLNLDVLHTLFHLRIHWNLHLSCVCFPKHVSYSISSESQVQWCVSSFCYSVKSHSVSDPDRPIETVNQSNRKGRKWYMRMKGKETCLKAMSSVEVGEFGLMSRYSHSLFPRYSHSLPNYLFKRSFDPSGRSPCKPSFSERQYSMDIGVRPTWVVIPDPPFTSFVNWGKFFFNLLSLGIFNINHKL